MDRLTGLTVFVQVVDSGGFAAAARRLRMSTTMVSAHVQALENRLGARLLNRTTRKVSVTDTGAAYYERCTQILGELEEADHLASELATTVRGTLRLYLGAALVRFVAPVILEFQDNHRDVAIQLIIGDREVNLLEEGFDLAILTTPPPDSSLIVRHLTPWRHVLCGTPEYLKQHGAPQRLEDVARHNCLRYAYYPFGDHWHFTDPSGAAAQVRVTGDLIANSADMLRAAALAGRGLFLAPSFVVIDELAAGRLVPVLRDHVPVDMSINATYPHRHHLSTKVRRFLDLVAERLTVHRHTLDPYPPKRAAAAI